ncbi:hypothetical protein EI94DRAFT_1798688 [Lactarius quietus]|nr:hypothetical protein EI94DRAFT_1798688 [Lactarius quietus]
MSSFLLPDSADDSFDVPVQEDQSVQAYDGLWNFSSTGADTSFPQGSYPGMGSHISETDICALSKAKVLTDQGPNIQSIISNASKKALDQNVFHARVKWHAGQQKIEITKLQELVTSQKKELEELQLLNNSHHIKAYSCWSGNHGVRDKKVKDEKEYGELNLKILKNESLIRMDLEDEPNVSDTPGTSHTPDKDAHSDGFNNKVLEPSTVRRSEIKDPFALTVPTATPSTPQGTTNKGLTPPPPDSAASSAEPLPQGQGDAHPSPQNVSTTAPSETALHATTMSPQAAATTTPSGALALPPVCKVTLTIGTRSDGNTSAIGPTTMLRASHTTKAEYRLNA